MFYEHVVNNHTKLIDFDNISWIDLQKNEIGMDDYTAVVYTNHGTVLTLNNEDATAFVDAYKAHKLSIYLHRDHLNHCGTVTVDTLIQIRTEAH